MKQERDFMCSEYAERGDVIQAVLDFRRGLLREGCLSEVEALYGEYRHPRLNSDPVVLAGVRVRWSAGEGV